MKERHKDHKRNNARAVLSGANVKLGQDFHTLTTTQVDSILVEADRVRYQKPNAANGSRGRYFHDLLQRRAQWRPGDK